MDHKYVLKKHDDVALSPMKWKLNKSAPLILGKAFI